MINLLSFGKIKKCLTLRNQLHNCLRNMDFFSITGKMAIGSRLRRLSERLTNESAEVYATYGHDFQPKWFPVFYTLWSEGEKSITQIASFIGHSHPSVSKIVGELIRKGLLEEVKSDVDRRCNMVRLSDTGRDLARQMSDQLEDVGSAVESIMAETNHDIWKAIEEWEFMLGQKSLLQRTIEIRKARESKKVHIVEYEPQYQRAFHDLNEEWIQHYFKMEPTDYKSLDDPEGYILSKGGYILIALYEGDPVGVCALIKMHDDTYDFELAKMAVAPRAQGKNIGYLLGLAVMEKARQVGAQKLYLESNTLLKSAINLYYKLGFTKVTGRPTPYERCNIQMEVML
jgi:DNA-binding MarR family transcriptional regulator